MFFKRDRACVSRALLRMGFFLCPFFSKSWAPNTEILVFFFTYFFFVLLGLIIQKSSSVYHQKQKSHISQVFFQQQKMINGRHNWVPFLEEGMSHCVLVGSVES